MSNDNKDLFSVLNHAQSRIDRKENTQYTSVHSEIAVPAVPVSSLHHHKEDNTYNASSIRILEGLEPVRLRPGMYIGGTDSKALHHLFSEIIDNAMDEAVAGYADLIDITLDSNNYLTVTDNGRGIPIENHPQIPDKSTLEVIMTHLHSGGKFDGKAYQTSGGLHGVGISVVNALSDDMEVEVARERKLYRQRFSRGIPQSELDELGDVYNRRGTRVCFHPDSQIFGENTAFDPEKIYKIARSKAYLFNGVKIRWHCDPAALKNAKNIPEKDIFYFPDGLKDYLSLSLKNKHLVTAEIFSGKTQQLSGHGSVEWAIAWHNGDAYIQSYCNTIPTEEGGTHETGLRQTLLRGLKAYAELIGNKRASIITSDDVMASMVVMLSIFIKDPQFVGQTKNRLATTEAQRIVENAIRDPFDHWLVNSPHEATKLLNWVIERAEERLKRRQDREINRKTAVRKLRLPGKLADCSQNSAANAELFIVEGDSAGGSAKQARNRTNQAILPLRGKILNVANAAHEKMSLSQTISDLILALGCGTRSKYREEDLRYERIIIMTDADVDGAHIASLLITFFFQEIPDLIRAGHLYLAVPPLYRISQGGKVAYARDDSHKDELLKTEFTGKSKIEIGRFKGLGEMRAEQLKETTMNPKKRTLLRVSINTFEMQETKETVQNLMGSKPEERFRFIQESSIFANNLDI
ncbi:DNA topoisomerase IV subunit B [Bartonella bacilliformis]|uniref:DNA topoisomerase 4 subunit B n=1 Tax=Bartonella bacilliformis Ver097 TaxID=1293911 RepID=A0A072R1M7_BARBA|nr:DNA topoisomerase IV subunit B [Bartonella bacilliformis]KEG19640.1 DNA gyrase subunit B [Bartonella bacilliformis Ver097]